MTRPHSILALILILALIPVSGPAREEARAARTGAASWCGTDDAARLPVAAARHLQSQRRLARENHELAKAGLSVKAPATRKEGHIAVIQDDGTLLSDIRLFDLQDRGLKFVRKDRGTRTKRTGYGFRQPFGDRLAIGDDATVTLDLPFTFPFLDGSYDRVFINSDGNLTFGTADSASTSRDLSRFLNGPPRIAGLFVDLDPSVTSGDDGVFFADLGNRVQITWVRVPEYGATNQNSFQITLLPNGRILLWFDQVDADLGIVGISPGGDDDTTLELFDLSEEIPLATRPRSVAIAEQFSDEISFDELAAVAVFLEHFRDVYDHVLFWHDYPLDLGDAFAFELTVRNEIEGIGAGIFDASAFVGSSAGGKFRSIVEMGSLANYPDNHDLEFLGTNSTMDLIGHETGHRWLASVRFMDSTGNTSADLLGRQQAHWSYFMDSDGSFMEGNDIQDNGDGTFTTVGATETYSKLDQYIMGLIPPSEVGPFFYVGGTSGDATAAPSLGNTFSGTRVDLAMRDIFAVEGRRKPKAAQAPKSFKMAFVLVGRDGEPVSVQSIDKLDGIRRAWIDFFNQVTDGLATVSTTLRENK